MHGTDLNGAVRLVKTLRLHPGDVIVVECARPISPEQAEQLKLQIQSVVGPFQVIIADENLTVSVQQAQHVSITPAGERSGAA